MHPRRMDTTGGNWKVLLALLPAGWQQAALEFGRQALARIRNQSVLTPFVVSTPNQHNPLPTVTKAAKVSAAVQPNFEAT